MRIVLLLPFNTRELPYFPNLGLPYIQAHIKSHGYDDVFLGIESLIGRKGVSRMLQQVKPDVVGVTCLSFYRHHAMELLRLSRQIVPQAKNILGGVHATIMYEQLLTHYPDLIDRIVLGEGEETFLELIRDLDQGSDGKSVKGLACRSNGMVTATGQRPPLKDLDRLSFPRQEIFSLPEFPGKRLAVIHTSRGCGYGCYYCSTTRFWKKWRPRSPRNIKEEMQAIVNGIGAQHIMITDDAFTMDAQRVKTICSFIRDQGLNRACSFSCSARADKVDPEMLQAMKEANFIKLSYGIESGSNTMLKLMHKQVTRNQVIQAVNWTNQVGIKVNPSFMVGNKGETQETIDETCDLIRHCGIKELAVSRFVYIFPGTPLADIAKKEGLLTDDFWLGPDPVIPYIAEHPVTQLSRWQAQIFKTALQNMTLLEKIRFIVIKAGRLSFKNLFRSAFRFMVN